jgi:hypothetical protein
MMIKEAFRDNKNFIVARVKSRGKDKYDNDKIKKKNINYDVEA